MIWLAFSRSFIDKASVNLFLKPWPIPKSKVKTQLTIENIVIQTPYSILPRNKIRIGTIKKFKKTLIPLNVIPKTMFLFWTIFLFIFGSYNKFK